MSGKISFSSINAAEPMNGNFPIALLPLPAFPQQGNIQINFNAKDAGRIQSEGYNAKNIYKLEI